jgi:hypothetical protein
VRAATPVALGSVRLILAERAAERPVAHEV